MTPRMRVTAALRGPALDRETVSGGFGRLEDSPVYADQFQIYTGNANRDLSQKICRYLSTELGRLEVFSSRTRTSSSRSSTTSARRTSSSSSPRRGR